MYIIVIDVDSNVDESGNGVLVFSIVDGNEEGYFVIDRFLGKNMSLGYFCGFF